MCESFGIYEHVPLAGLLSAVLELFSFLRDELADLVSGGLGLVVEVLGLFASLAAWC